MCFAAPRTVDKKCVSIIIHSCRSKLLISGFADFFINDSNAAVSVFALVLSAMRMLNLGACHRIQYESLQKAVCS